MFPRSLSQIPVICFNTSTREKWQTLLFNSSLRLYPRRCDLPLGVQSASLTNMSDSGRSMIINLERETQFSKNPRYSFSHPFPLFVIRTYEEACDLTDVGFSLNLKNPKYSDENWSCIISNCEVERRNLTAGRRVVTRSLLCRKSDALRRDFFLSSNHLECVHITGKGWYVIPWLQTYFEFMNLSADRFQEKEQFNSNCDRCSDTSLLGRWAKHCPKRD